jgi:hypothetical protein
MPTLRWADAALRAGSRPAGLGPGLAPARTSSSSEIAVRSALIASEALTAWWKSDRCEHMRLMLI